MVKKIKKEQEKSPKEKIILQKHPLSQPSPKNFRYGNDIRPRIVKSRFVKFPRYVELQRQKLILMKRLKCPPALCQFLEPLDNDNTKKLFKILEKYAPETKKEKKERLKNEAKENENGKKKDGNKPTVLKYGLNHITYLIEQKKAKMILIAADVDPIEIVAFLPSLCKTMDVPYAIVSSKARLGNLVGKKTTTCLALTDFKDNAVELDIFCKAFREKFQGPPLHSRKPEKGFKFLAREKKTQQLLVNK